MVGLGSATLLTSSEAWSTAPGLITIFTTVLLGAFVAYLRYRVLRQRDETDRLVRTYEQANRAYEISLQERQLSLQERQLALQERNADVTTLFLEVARLDIEARLAERAKGEEVQLAAE